MGAMRGSPDLIELGRDGRGEDRFTTRDMIEAEQRLHRAAEVMAGKELHAVSDRDRTCQAIVSSVHGWRRSHLPCPAISLLASICR